MYKDAEDHMKMCKAAAELNEPIMQREELKKVSVSVLEDKHIVLFSSELSCTEKLRRALTPSV